MDFIWNFTFDFSDLFVSMRNTGILLAGFFSNFGAAFTKPFIEGWLQVVHPSIYKLIAPLFTLYKDFLNMFLSPEAVDLILGYSLFDLVIFGTGLVIIANLVRKILEALPLA